MKNARMAYATLAAVCMATTDQMLHVGKRGCTILIR